MSRHPELIEYSKFARQLEPFVEAFGFESVMAVFFPRLVTQPQAELERIGRFVGHDGLLRWDTSLRPQNVGRDLLRPNPIRDALVRSPVLSPLRQRIVPRNWSQSLKERWRAKIERPTLPAELIARLRDIFDADLAQLGSWLGIELDCESFNRQTVERSYEWTERDSEPRRKMRAPRPDQSSPSVRVGR